MYTRFISFFFSLMISFTLLQCNQDPSFSAEDTVKTYQKLIDQNKFSEAKSLCTPHLVEIINGFELIFDDNELAPNTITKFNSIDCVEKQDTVRCICELEDEYEIYTSLFTLIKIEGEWKVDASSDADEETFEHSIEIIETEKE